MSIKEMAIIHYMFMSLYIHVIFRSHVGLIFSGGHMWRQQRRFAVATLKYFGVGRKTLENSILQECQFVCEALRVERGQFLFNFTSISFKKLQMPPQADI